jgi:hypothetical protein
MDSVYLIVIVVIIIICIFFYINNNSTKKSEQFKNSKPSEDYSDYLIGSNDYTGYDGNPYAYKDSLKDDDYKSYTNSKRAYNGQQPVFINSVENNTNNKMDVNDGMGVVESDPTTATYTSGNTKYTTEELYDSKLLLPGKITKEEKEWLNLPPEAVKISDRNLLTVNRPVGIDTIGQTLRNASHDLRGNGVPNPKVVVSPWNQSTIDADLNTNAWF